VIGELAGGAEIEGGVGVCGGEAEGGAEAVFRFGDVALFVMDHAKVVMGVGAFRIEQERLALADDGIHLLAPGEADEPEVDPGLLEVGIEGKGVAVERFGFLDPALGVEVEAFGVFYV
jgi:hypothetical protein